MSSNKFKPVASSPDTVSEISVRTVTTTPVNRNKTSRLFSSIGTIDEILAVIGTIKSEHLNSGSETKTELDASSKLFLCARLTQIQETLLDLQNFLSKKSVKFEVENRLKEIQSEINLMELNKNIVVIPGTTSLESILFLVRALVRRLERQFCGLKDIPEIYREYLNKLSDYFSALTIHVLYMQNREPMVRKTKKNPI